VANIPEPIDPNLETAQYQAARAAASSPVVRQALDEEAVAHKYVVSRYHTLTNRKHLNGLTPQENEELDALSAVLDAMEEPYYDAIIKRLRTLVETGVPE
jgi:hypothetical protein